MATKIITLPHTYFSKSNKQLPLSKPMIAALTRACVKQQAGIPFGQREVDGSFIPLIKRGLIIRKAGRNEDDPILWQVTSEAIRMLKNLGIEGAC
jgi:hypothetical protein